MRFTKVVTLLTFCFLPIFSLPSSSFRNAMGDDTPASPESVLVNAIAGFNQQERRRRGVVQPVDNSPLNAAKVRRSIRLAIEFLKNEQNKDGHWKHERSEGDTTALCALALMNAGISSKDPMIKKAIDHIRSIESPQTYFVSLRVMCLATADPKGKIYLADIRKDVEWLVKTRCPDGGWSYPGSMKIGDSSNSQFALLALHEASRIGIKIPKTEWEKIKGYWAATFKPKEGGFAYYRMDEGRGVRGSMTCAGICSWIIIQENLADPANGLNGDFANCCGIDPNLDLVESGFNWLAKNYTVRTNPKGNPGTVLYYLYGLERAGRLSGRRFIGGNDWYRDGAKQLLKWQNGGSWATRNGHGEKNPLVATSFALLFLSKGKRPVAIGKFDHGTKDWDLHPKGVHFLTRRLEKEWNLKLNWQTVRARNATVDDFLEAPVLFMSGKDALLLDQKQKDNLKLYLENGGFLFAEACEGEGCGNANEYDRAFRQLMFEIFPDSELAPLEPDHSIWSSHYPLSPNEERPLLGVQACCRTSVVYCPKNLSCYWTLDQSKVFNDQRVNIGLKRRIEYCSRVGVNVVAYATNRQLKDKGETPKLVQDQKETLAERALVFPKLRHSGGADDAPNAWRNVLQQVSRLGLEINMEKKLIEPTVENLKSFPFVFVHGRSQFSFTKEQREAIRKHLELGGFVFADSVCASEEFTKSFRNEMKAILGKSLQPIAPNHEIWTDRRFGHNISQVTLRIKDAKAKGGFREQIGRPELEGAEINGRLAVVFSPLDLSCALESSTGSQCTGYTKDDAIKIGSNVILYSMLSDSSGSR